MEVSANLAVIVIVTFEYVLFQEKAAAALMSNGSRLIASINPFF